MKVIINGDRNVTDSTLIDKAINKAGIREKITEVVSGGARGADKLGEAWAKNNNIPVKIFKADWGNLNSKNAVIKTKVNPWNGREEKYNANAGFERNQAMVNYADAVIAIQYNGKTNGTQDCIERAKKKGIPIYEYEREHKDYEFDF